MRKNIVANFIGQGWSALMGLCFIPTYITYIGIEAYGLIGIYAALQTWLALLDMGMTPTLVREMSRYVGKGKSNESIHNLLRSIEVISLLIALIIIACLGLTSSWIASSWLKVESLPTHVVAQTFIIIGVVISLRFLEGIYRSALIGLQHQVLLNMISAFIATLRWGGVVAILAFISPTIQAFFLWQCLISVVSIAILVAITYTSLPVISGSAKFSITSLREVWSYAAGMMGIGVLSLFLTQIDKVLLSRLLKLSDYGYYTLASTAAGGVYFLISPITQALLPRLSQLHASGEINEVVRSFHLGAQLSSVIFGSFALMLIFFSSELLQLWTQDETLAFQVAPLLSLLALGNMINGLMWVPFQTQLAYGITSLTIRVNLIAVIFFVPGVWWAVLRYDAIGAAWLWILLNIISMIVVMYFMHKVILCGERWSWYWEDTLRPLLSATLVLLFFRFIVPMPASVVGITIWLIIVVVLVSLSAAMSAKYIRDILLQYYRFL